MSQTHAIVQSVEELTPSILRLSLVRADGRFFPEFTPGQYATLSFPAFARLKSERSFSIASSATDLRRLEFGIRTGGPYTNVMRALRPGDHAMVASPFGQFIFDPSQDQSAVLIAGGIGITPLLSMIRTASAQQLPNELILIYSVRSMTEAAYAMELDTLEQENPNFHVIYAVSDGQVPAHHPRYIAGRLTSDVLAAAVQQNPCGRSFFLCGPPPFMTAVSRMLRQIGLPLEAVRSERFAVASSAIIEPASMWPKITFAAWGVAASILFATIIRIERDRRLAINAAAAVTLTNTATPSPTNTISAPETTNPTITPLSAPVTTTPTAPTPATTPTTTTPVTTYTPPVRTYVPPVIVPSPRTTVS